MRVKKLALPMRTIHYTLHRDLNLSKKYARWICKLMTHDMKMDRVRTCEAFLVVVRYHPMAMLDIDESAVLCLSTL